MTLTSVVIPAYNAARSIGATLSSVTRQTVEHLEVVVVDDGSTDDTAEIVRSFDDPRVRMVQQPNGGLSAARNAGIAAAKGTLIALVDADDLWLPTWLESTTAALAADPRAGMAYTDAWVLEDETWRIQRVHAMAYQDPPREPISDPNDLFNELLKRNFIVMSVVVPRTVFDRFGGFAENLRRAEDYELWLRLSHNGYRLAHVPERLMIHRDHVHSLSADFSTMIDAQITMYTFVADTYDLDADARKRVERRVADWQHFREVENDPSQRTLEERLMGIARGVKRRVEDPRRWLRQQPPAVAETLAATNATSIG